MRLFDKPSELLEYVKDRKPYPLSGCLGWAELEDIAYHVLQNLVNNGDSWYSKVQIENIEKEFYYCGIGNFTRKLSEYFIKYDDGYEISVELFIKLHPDEYKYQI